LRAELLGDLSKAAGIAHQTQPLVGDFILGKSYRKT
jgi:hypothetical protein